MFAPGRQDIFMKKPNEKRGVKLVALTLCAVHIFSLTFCLSYLYFTPRFDECSVSHERIIIYKSDKYYSSIIDGEEKERFVGTVGGEKLYTVKGDNDSLILGERLYVKRNIS